MPQETDSVQRAEPHDAGEPTPASPEQGLLTLDTLLERFEDAAAKEGSPNLMENQFLLARLGVASGLFAALRVKHGPTAEHSLRVALICSAWAEAMGLLSDARDELEIASLLHDIGKIGVPDEILRRPSALSQDQAAIAQRAKGFSLSILAHCVSDGVLETIAHVGAWYDGSHAEYPKQGDDIPLAARMIHIVDAYDNLTTDKVYRRALPQQNAIADLFRAAGSEFDLRLVKGFAKAILQEQLTFAVASRSGWMASLASPRSSALWALRLPQLIDLHDEDELPYFMKELFDGLHDGVFLLNDHGAILRWSRGAERMTGLKSAAVEQKSWVPSLVKLRDRESNPIPDTECPILAALGESGSVFSRMLVCNRLNEHVTVDIYVTPVSNRQGSRLGAVVVLRDASSQRVLEAQVKSLHQRATTDGLTGVSNRAEFDRIHPQLVVRHLQKKTPYSLIICDIDRFKAINDKFGHQAGDEALVSFARVLRQSCRQGDIVARYGGEEFLIICENCDIREAAALAEKIRLRLAGTNLKELSGQCITASFGVTEVQPGDSAETMLRRADRGLLRAKDSGRNRVVQLGTGMVKATSSEPASRWWSWMQPRKTQTLLEALLRTNVPLNIAIEKLRGFVADHEASVTELQENRILLQIHCARALNQRRHSDRTIPFRVELNFRDSGAHPDRADPSKVRHTEILVRIEATRDRDRRANPIAAARQVLNSLRAYLMAEEVPKNNQDPASEGR